MAQEWFIVRNGKEFGPYSPQHLKGFASKGELAPDDLVRRGDLPTAKPARSIKGLFPDAPPTPPSVPTSPPVASLSPPIPTVATLAPNEPVIPAKSFLDKLPVSRKVAIISGIGTVVVIALCCGIGGLVMSGGDKHIQMVKNGHLSGYPNVPLGKAIDRYLSNPRWESGKSSDGQVFVNVRGGTNFQGKAVQATLQFHLDPTNGSFECNALKLNDIGQNGLIKAGLLTKIMSEYRP